MKNIRKTLCLIMALSLSLSVCAVGAYATDSTVSEADAFAIAYVSELSGYVDERVSEISTFVRNTQGIGLDGIVSDFLEEHADEYDADLMGGSSSLQTIVVDADNRVVIDGSRIFVEGKDIVAATPERIAAGAAVVSPLARASGTTSILSYYHAEYGGLGTEIWRVTQEAQFTYTGSSVTVNYSEGYYTRGFLSAWQVSNWEDSSVSTINGSTKKVKSSGNFHWGIEYNGNGIIFQDYYVSIDVRCTANGAVSSYYTMS